MKRLAIKTLAFCLTFVLGPAFAQAGGHGFWSVGINLGFPVCYRPWCGYYGYPYYAPYPVYVALPPVYVVQPPVAQALPPAPVAYPAPAYQPAQAAPTAPIPAEIQDDPRQTEIARHLRQLAVGDEQVRADGVLQLGRMKATSAIDPIAARLSGDTSPNVREAAARALGLIGSSKGLASLERAAHNDSDRDVRRSAQFAVEVIQSNR